MVGGDDGGAAPCGVAHKAPAEEVVAAVAFFAVEGAVAVGGEESAGFDDAGAVLRAAALAGLFGKEEVVELGVDFGAEGVGQLPAVAKALGVVDVKTSKAALAGAAEVEAALFVVVERGDVVAVAVDGGAEVGAVARASFGNHDGVPEVHAAEAARTVGTEIEYGLAVGQVAHGGVGAGVLVEVDVAAHGLDFAPMVADAAGVVDVGDVVVFVAVGEVDDVVLGVVCHIAAVCALAVEAPLVEEALSEGAVGMDVGLKHLHEYGGEVDEVEFVGILFVHRGVEQYAVGHNDGSAFAAEGVDVVVDVGAFIMRLAAGQGRKQ